MGSSPKKKNQHYVPRTLLRGFSRDERSISVLVLKSGRRVAGASIGDQCAKSFFYGKDDTVENGLAVVEGNFTTAIGDRSAGRLEAVSSADVMHIIFFTHLQRSRTVAAAASVSAVGDGMIRRLLAKDHRIQEKGIDLGLVRFVHSSPQMLALQHAFASGPLVFDLDVKFLVAERGPGFVLSDDPVVLYNQYAEHHPRLRRWPCITGLAHKGLQIFLPISATACICLFDPLTYEYGSPASRICKPSVRDIRILNDLQAMNARECIYFDDSKTPAEEVERLRDTHRLSAGWRDPRFVASEEREETRGRRSQLIGVEHPSPRLDFSFGFARVIDHELYADWRLATIPVRSWETIEEMKRLKKEMDARVSGVGNVVAPTDVDG
jgi:hypothetical protein